MIYRCVYCNCSPEQLILIPPNWATILDLDHTKKNFVCQYCGQLCGIFCVYDHNCYCVYAGDNSSYCPWCLADYLEIALYNIEIAKEISKEFLYCFKSINGIAEVTKFRVQTKLWRKVLYVEAARNCAFNAALGIEACRQIIMRHSHCIPQERIYNLTAGIADNIHRN